MAQVLALSFDPKDPNTDHEEGLYRNALGDGLEEVLGGGADSPAEIAKGLNSLKIFAPDGESWTEELLEKELRRLAW